MTMLQLTAVEEMWSLVWALPRNAALEMAFGLWKEKDVGSALVSSDCDKRHGQNRATKQVNMWKVTGPTMARKLMYIKN